VGEDHLGHHALVSRMNLKLTIAVGPDEIALLDERNDGCRVVLHLVDHPGTPQLAVDDRDLADDGVPPGGNGVVLAIDVHDGRLREHEAAAKRKAEREMNADMAFYIERELRDRGVRNISHDDIFKIMPEVRAAASKIHYGSQTEIMANIVQEKLAPKQSRGMRR
jgi:hypothetical protein